MYSDPLVTLENVGKRYPGHRVKWLLNKIGVCCMDSWSEVLKDCSFSIRPGESVGIVGRNGSGKSTLVQMIAGTTSITVGTIYRRGRIGAMLDLTMGFRPELTGRQSIYLAGALAGLGRDEMDPLVPLIADFSEAGPMLDRPLAHYSSGTWLRVAFAAQTFIEYDLLIVDEALQVGDIFFRQKCTTRIKELFSKGTALLLVSHDPSVLRELCSRGIVLNNNTIVYDGPIDDALRYYHSSAARTAPHSGTEAAEVMPHDYQILGVDVRDAAGGTRETFTIGDEAVFRIRFTGGPELNRYRVILELKDRFGSHVSTLYSDRYEPLPDGAGTRGMSFVFRIRLDLEAGEYTYQAGIGRAARLNGTDISSSSGWKGPIIIDWNYTEKPAPFLGKFGIAAAGYLDGTKRSE